MCWKVPVGGCLQHYAMSGDSAERHQLLSTTSGDCPSSKHERLARAYSGYAFLLRQSAESDQLHPMAVHMATCLLLSCALLLIS